MLSLLLAGCSFEAESTSPSAGPTLLDGGEEVPPSADDDASAPEHSVDFPQTPAGEATQEVVETLNASAETTAEDWEDRLHEDVTAEVSAEDLAQTLNLNIRPAGPWRAVDYQGEDYEAVTVIESETTQLELHLRIDEEDQLIQTLFFADPQAAAEPAEGFEEIHQRLEDLPGDVSALVVEDGEHLLQINPDEPAPLASVSKLYVMLALADAVEAGEADWTDPMELTEELRSLPSGTLQDQPEGYTTIIADVAQRMIEVSDNTGTDMLIDYLGREAVEDAVAEAGHHNPELIQPYLTTRELFQLRWGHPELGEDWEDLEVDERREVLAELEDEPLELDYRDVSGEDVDLSIDWFASATDIAVLLDELEDRAEDQPELHTYMGANPGLVSPVEEPWWESLVFKGGGLPGVVTGAWQAVDAEGATRTVVILAHHEDSELGEERAEIFQLAQDALIIGTESEQAQQQAEDDEDDDADTP